MLRVRKGIHRTRLVSANKKVSWKNQTFPSLSWSVKPVMAIKTVMAIVTVLAIETNMALATVLAIAKPTWLL